MTTTTATGRPAPAASRRTTTAGDRGRDAALPWRLAAADTLTVASGMVSFGLVLGITIDAVGRDRLAGIVGAAAVYGGSAQLTTTTLLASGSAVVLAVLSGVVVNLRLLLSSAAMGDRFAGQPPLFRWFGPFFMIDQTFLMAETRRDLGGWAFRRYWLWLGGFVLAVWTASVAAGELLAPVLPPLPHLTLVCTAMFLGLLVPRLVTRPAVVAAVVGGLTAAVVSALLPALGIVAGAVAGVAAACALRDPSTRP
jgi:predicted branched-subunit amino acid permease